MDDGSTNPLSAVDATTKKQLLSLQVLFPNEFLPALDLLDRGLVTRFRIGNVSNEIATKQDAHTGTKAQQTQPDEAQSIDQHMLDQPAHTSGVRTSDARSHNPTADQPMADVPLTEPATLPPPLDTIYYARSAQQRSSRYSTSYDTIICYEVRLLAWNCSCPAFAFAAFPGSMSPVYYTSGDSPTEDRNPMSGDNKCNKWVFGGVSLGEAMPPVCKHLLACVLAERCEGLFGKFVKERVVSVEEAAGWAAGWGDS